MSVLLSLRSARAEVLTLRAAAAAGAAAAAAAGAALLAASLPFRGIFSAYLLTTAGRVRSEVRELMRRGAVVRRGGLCVVQITRAACKPRGELAVLCEDKRLWALGAIASFGRMQLLSLLQSSAARATVAPR